MTPPVAPHHDDLPAAIADLARLIGAARLATDEGQLVELDLVAMRIAVLCDAVGSLDPVLAKPLRPALDAVMNELNGLDFALRRRNLDLSLDLAQADRRLRAQMAYGGKPDKS
ncbi:hypothetical protein [Dongia sp.]|uniref:hypothetical protein n=1 Tax=Dongia sp. TaxID=1977262 RepID=UPI0035AE078D